MRQTESAYVEIYSLVYCCMTIGPVPATRLVVEGSVLGIDKTQRRLICEIDAVRVSDAPENHEA
jgi:predicted transcriptional regulator